MLDDEGAEGGAEPIPTNIVATEWMPQTYLEKVIAGLRFRGGLQVISMDGYGTDAYLHLAKLGVGACEALPRIVRESPGGLVSSLYFDEERDVAPDRRIK